MSQYHKRPWILRFDLESLNNTQSLHFLLQLQRHYNIQMFGRKGSGAQTTKFYKTPDTVEVHCGYLYKSPPGNILSKSLKSWKRRYFVLSRDAENIYELKYFKDENKQEKPAGDIQLYQISLLFLQPETHPMWEWINKNFKCAPSCVLYLRVTNRNYFLIGENSGDMDIWFNDIFQALKTRPRKPISCEENTKVRSASDPQKLEQDKRQGISQHLKKTADQRPSPSGRLSTPESAMFSYYSFPKAIKHEDEDDEEDEQEDDLTKEISEETDSSYYMDMTKVIQIARENSSEDDSCLNARLDRESKIDEKVFQNCSDSQNLQESQTFNSMEKEICMSQEELRNGVIFSEEDGKPCVSDCRLIRFSNIFHKGDQILAINDLLTDSLDEVQTYLKRLSKDQVKLTILRQPGSRPLSKCSM